jgi:hypothetical protein
MSWLPSVAKGRRTPEIGAEVAVDQLGRWHLHHAALPTERLRRIQLGQIADDQDEP